MSKTDSERNVQFFLILANLPESVLRQPPAENWKPVKDLIYSHINSEDREYGRIDIADGVAICRMHDVEQRREAYDALQGLSWRNIKLKAWLCEKRGNIMGQSAGPVDRWNGNVVPAPGRLMRMTPSLAGHITCMPFAQPLPNRPFVPQYGTAFVPPLAANVGRRLPPQCPSRVHSVSAYDMHSVERIAQVLPPHWQSSSMSDMSATYPTFPRETVHQRLGDDSSVASTALVTQAASSSGRSSVSGSSSTSATSGPISSASSNQSSDASQPRGDSGHNKIKIHNFNPKVSMTDLQLFNQRMRDLHIVRMKTRKGNGRSLRVFITFHTDEDARIAVQRLDGCVVGGMKLSVSLDLQRHWQPLVTTGKSSPWSPQNSFPVGRTGAGKSLSTATVRKEETKPQKTHRGPVIIDGSQE